MASWLMYGGGLIGSAAAARMAAAGQALTVVTRAPEPQHLSGVEWRFGDLSDGAFDSLLKDRSALIYAAGSMAPASQVQSVAKALSDQVIPVVALAERSAASGVANFVFISSGGTVYGHATQVPTPENAGIAPINAYGMVKAQTEQALLEVGRRTGMRIVILRVANPYGPGQQGNRRLGFIAAAVEAVRQDSPLDIWGDGQATRDFVHLDDVAEAILRAASYCGESAIFNIGTARETSLLEICKIVSDLSGRPLKLVFHEGRSVDVQRNCLAIDHAATVLSWRPRVALQDGISALLQAG